MSDNDNLILRILAELRDELRETNARIDRSSAQTSARIDQTNARIDQVSAAVRRAVEDTAARFNEGEIRAATRHTDLVASSRDLHTMLEDRFDLRDSVERIETDVELLKRKVG